jgi:hypothetical protein
MDFNLSDLLSDGDPYRGNSSDPIGGEASLVPHPIHRRLAALKLFSFFVQPTRPALRFWSIANMTLARLDRSLKEGDEGANWCHAEETPAWS